MGIVKISDGMHENLRIASDALSRSINAQAEHWMRVGMLAELHPGLDHRDICQLLIRAEMAGGFDLRVLAAESSSASTIQSKVSRATKRAKPITGTEVRP